MSKANHSWLPIVGMQIGKNNRAKGNNEMETTTNTLGSRAAIFFLAGMLFAGCAGGPLSTREKGAGIGALGGAAAGGLVGAAVGHPGAGAAIGGGLGLGAGALVGDQLQGHENTNYRQQQQINRNQAEINRNRQDLERIRRQSEY
ncbi:MAG TPA: glycine zipper domain-containing protein [Candidatus Udaeobacter sp.]|nr:glycine zipper domain-containing protein [Candidatus Udaeobacter sp.]